MTPLGFSLRKQKGMIRLIGNEARIRYFMVAFFWRTFSGLQWPFKGLLQKNVKRSLKNSIRTTRFLSIKSN
ncbi:hypothetical protein [Enterococcus gallinarum]|uniref:hypothetical protein n=1 Tax=Enterococcus gallinarum TaxID=1353 RepID=UPI0025842607|nr:hypothetical protein [uncultured Enterococcus sp.]